jgi:hypothetical protein
VVPADASELEYLPGRTRGVMSGPLDESETNAADAEITDNANDDAMALLERLAAALRVRDPSLSKAQAFTKAYVDNPRLAAKERRSAMARLGVEI